MDRVVWRVTLASDVELFVYVTHSMSAERLHAFFPTAHVRQTQAKNEGAIFLVPQRLPLVGEDQRKVVTFSASAAHCILRACA